MIQFFLRRQLIKAVYAFSCGLTAAVLNFVFRGNIAESVFVLAAWSGVMLLLLVAYDEGHGLTEVVPVTVPRETPIAHLVASFATFAVLFTIPAFGLFSLWAKNVSFVSAARSPIWEQTIFVFGAVIIDYTGYCLVARKLRAKM